MPKNQSGSADRPSARRRMPDAVLAEMQSIVRRAAEPWTPGDSVKAVIGRASRRLGIGYRRARAFWYGEACAVRAVEADHLRAMELRLLRDRRVALAREMTEIEARLNAREGSADDLAQDDLPQSRTVLSLAREGVDEPGCLVREARVAARRSRSAGGV